jgi:hypothetical protein
MRQVKLKYDFIHLKSSYLQKRVSDAMEDRLLLMIIVDFV